MNIDTKIVDEVAHLARLEFDEKAKEEIIGDMNRMLSFIDKLSELDTANVEPLIYMTDEVNVMRDDEPIVTITQADALKNATNNTSVTINSVVWRVGTACGTPSIGGVAVEFSNVGSCTASSTIAFRPMINNLNWGGMGTGSTVSQASQTMTLTFS